MSEKTLSCWVNDYPIRSQSHPPSKYRHLWKRMRLTFEILHVKRNNRRKMKRGPRTASRVSGNIFRLTLLGTMAKAFITFRQTQTPPAPLCSIGGNIALEKGRSKWGSVDAVRIRQISSPSLASRWFRTLGLLRWRKSTFASCSFQRSVFSGFGGFSHLNIMF